MEAHPSNCNQNARLAFQRFHRPGGSAMGNFLPLSIKLVDGKTMTVSSICQAETALQGKWPNKGAAPYRDACRLIAGAKEGSCSPAIAFAAFKAAAIDQRLLQAADKSAALKMLDDVSKDVRT
jgi:hypothetical protein